MTQDDPCTRYNKARDRAQRREFIKDRLKIAGLVILFIYVVWDTGHYDPDGYDTAIINHQP